MSQPGIGDSVGTNQVPAYPTLDAQQTGQQPGYQPAYQPAGQPAYQQPNYQPAYQQPGQAGYQPLANAPQHQANYNNPNQVVQNQQAHQVNVVVMNNRGAPAERGRGPYPGVTCCCCFEIMCGMKVLAVLTIIGGIGQIIYAGIAFTYAPAVSTDGKLTAYIILLMMMGLPNLINVYIMGKWLMEDSLKTRIRLLLGFKVLMLTQALVGLWQLVGAYIILGSTIQVYLLKTYPSQFGFTNGVCTVQGRCSLDSTLDDTLRYQRPAEIMGIIVQTFISVLLSYYYFTQGKRLVDLWA